VKQIYTEIEIHASPQKVWQVLTDFDHFQDWNPFIRAVRGKAETGTRLEVQLQPPGGKPMTFRPKVLKVEEGHELRWLGHFLVPGLFDGQHTFKIESMENGRVRFIQREKFRGILVPFLSRSLDGQTKRGFKQMNEALKARAEKPS
jgi:hypothetical protein